MIKVVKDLDQDWCLLEIEGIRYDRIEKYYQIVNKKEFFIFLLENNPTILAEDFPMSRKEFNEIFEKVKEIKSFSEKLKQYNKQMEFDRNQKTK